MVHLGLGRRIAWDKAIECNVAQKPKKAVYMRQISPSAILQDCQASLLYLKPANSSNHESYPANKIVMRAPRLEESKRPAKVSSPLSAVGMHSQKVGRHNGLHLIKRLSHAGV